MAAAHAFASHPAVGGDHDPLGRGVLQRLADDVGDLVRPLDLQSVVIDDADHDLLVSHDPADCLEIAGARGADFEGQRVGVDLIERLQSRLVALYVAEDALPCGLPQQVWHHTSVLPRSPLTVLLNILTNSAISSRPNGKPRAGTMWIFASSLWI